MSQQLSPFELPEVSHMTLYHKLGSLEAKIDAILLRMAEDRDNHKDEVIQLRAEHKNLNQRLAALEKWKWGVVGGASVVAVLFSFIIDTVKAIL